MMKRVSVFCCTLLTLALSCSDETTIYKDDLQEDVVLENDALKLQSGLSYDQAGVLDIFEEESNNLKYGKARAPDEAGDYPLTLIAQVKPPTYPGANLLTATHVDVEGDYAYVSYNTPGAEYFGAIQVINVANPHAPIVSSQLILLNTDINAIEYADGYVFAVGGVDAEASAVATANSFVAKILVVGGRLDTSAGITYGFQQGFNANHVFVDNNAVLVTSGRDGYLTRYRKSDLSIEIEAPFADLRSVSADNGLIAVLDAGLGVRILDATMQQIKEIPIATDFGPASKKMIDFAGDEILVSEAGKGAGRYSLATGALVEYVPILVNPKGVDPSNISTNAVAINEDIMLMANGGAGLCLVEESVGSSDVFGVIDLQGSTNFVASKGDYIFAASGTQGFQIIKLNRPSDSLVARCTGLPVYEGSAKLVVNQGQTAEFTGSKRFNTMNISGSLLLCGTWTSGNDATVHANALFEMNGSLAVGRNNRRRNITVDEGATMRVEGSLTIYGDLVLNDGATLEFLGPSSVVNIFGSVIQNGSVTINGDFDDVRNKF